MIRLPLSQTGPADKFAQAVQEHIQACAAQVMGKPGQQAPRHNALVEQVVARVPQTGPVASRGPDRFVALQYEIYDDLPKAPKTPEQEQALSVLRQTIG